MDDIRTPSTWKRPRAKTYDYNQEFGGSYYQPMIDYLDTKDMQGIFFERPEETIHLPSAAELISQPHKRSDELPPVPSVSKYLVKAYAQKIKEQNTSTVKTQSKMLNVMTSRKNLSHTLENNQQTHYDNVRLLKGVVPGREQANYYIGELGVLKVSKDYQADCTEKHMTDVAAGKFSCGSHLYGQGGTPFGEKFYEKELIKEVTNRIKFVNPERVIPVI